MILDKIIQKRKIRYQKIMQDKPLEELIKKVEKIDITSEDPFPFYRALSDKSQFRFICETKKASPSKGFIEPDYKPADTALEYVEAGADAISCLTEPDFFQGSDDHFTSIKEVVEIPMLRKDFVFSTYQIYESKLLGAEAVLLIVSMLTDEELNEFQKLAHSLNMDALVECHDEEEIKRALQFNPTIIGVNNRNLKDFTVDLENTDRLRDLVPGDIVFVGESGVSKASQVQELVDADVNALLIGETMMKAENKKEKLQELRGNN